MTDLPAIDERSFRIWMANNIVLLAAHGETQLDARSLISLQRGGVFAEVKRPTTAYGKFRQIVANPRHRRRVNSMPGPCILVRPNDGSEVNGSFVVADLLLESTVADRKVAVAYFDGLSADGLLTERCREIIRDSRSNLLSPDSVQWRKAAIQMYDAVEKDWLLNIAGLRQAISWDFEEGIRDFLTRLLRPSVDSVNTMEPQWWDPNGQRAEIVEAIVGYARDSRSLSEAATRYYRTLGHLPLSKDIGMGRLLSEWQNRQVAGSWTELRDWAVSIGSPLAFYHACEAALSTSMPLSPEQLGVFWSDVRGVVASESDDSGEWSNAWQLRFGLARHFCHYFEILLPWNDGQRVPVFAWWLSEQLASACAGRNVNLELFEDHFFSPTRLHWHLSRARAGSSELRLQTLFEPAIWPRALLALLGSHAREFDPAGPDTETRVAIEDAFARHAFQGFRYEHGDNAFAYACEAELDPALRGWSETYAEPERKDRIDAFLTLLGNLRAEPLDQQMIEHGLSADHLNFFGLRAAAYKGEIPESQLERLFRNDSTAIRLLTELSDNHLSLFTDVIFESAASSSGEWHVVAPHAFATACLACEDSEPRRVLFTLLVHCSVATDTVSAIRRILSQENKERFVELAAQLRAQLSAQINAPYWVTARIRAVVSALEL